MASSQTMRLQPIFDMAELCARKGIKNAVLSPGSRCAPLTLAFTQHPHIQTYAIPDERCAGFMALGLSQQSKNITVIICTSGSAVYNLAPAIVEAYYQVRFGKKPLDNPQRQEVEQALSQLKETLSSHRPR